MKICNLTLNNFRQFKGEHSLDFSTDTGKKVTLIIAESSHGKSTLIEAFKWVFYGDCKFKGVQVLNGDIKKTMLPMNKEKVTGRVTMEHQKTKYTIERKQEFHYINSKLECNDSILTFEYKDNDGKSKKLNNKESTQKIKEILHPDLFSYFFLKTENLEQVGKQMSKGASKSKNEFLNAIRGLLNLNYLIETQKHLTMLVRDYNKDISQSTANVKLQKTIDGILKNEEDAEKHNNKLNGLIEKEKYYEQKKNELHDQIIGYEEVGQKQTKYKELETELTKIKVRFNETKKQIFEKFSFDGFNYLLSKTLSEVDDILKKTDNMIGDEGIVGITVDAIKYILHHHKCICGKEVKENSEDWDKLSKLLEYLPPNNINYEVSEFRKKMQSIKNKGDQFKKEFDGLRRFLDATVDDYNDKKGRSDKLIEEMDINVDVKSLHDEYKSAQEKLDDTKFDIKLTKDEIARLKKEYDTLVDLRDGYKKQDERTKTLQKYCSEAEDLKRVLENYCKNKENEGRVKLEQEMNKLFKKFYNDVINFEINENYEITITDEKHQKIDDFTSTGQDVAVALSFIGAIIKLNIDINTEKNLEAVDEETNKEPYPLVMDAPLSLFGLKQMKTFSKVIPEVTDQIIIFINDKDGNLLNEDMNELIGNKYTLIKDSSYEAHFRKE